jgi:hypothetical protein
VEAEVALLVEGALDLEAGQVEVVHLVEEVLDLEVVLTEVHRIRWRSTRS